MLHLKYFQFLEYTLEQKWRVPYEWKKLMDGMYARPILYQRKVIVA